MRFCFADPPYPGKSRAIYGDHEDFAGEVDHAELITRLERDYDGWALCTSAKALPMVLRLCPPSLPNPKTPGDWKTGTGVSVLSWHKRVGRPGVEWLTNTWEPVILRNPRRPPRAGWRPNDSLDCPIELYTMRPTPDGHVTGAKPPAFCRWLFQCAGLQADDEFTDLFPGSGAVGEQWERFRREPSLIGSMTARSDRSHRDAVKATHPQLEGIA
jgi:hypothetical protein